MRSELAPLALGACAGIVGAAVQAIVGKGEELTFLPRRGDSDLAPRLVGRASARAGHAVSRPTRWALGTIFHFGYGAVWGAAYALADRRLRLHPLVGGAALGGVIYAMTFPRWGAAVQTGVVAPPERREPSMTVFAASVAAAFGLTTALTHAALRDVMPRLVRRVPRPASATTGRGGR